MFPTVYAIAVLATLAAAPMGTQTASERLAETMKPGLMVSIVDEHGRKTDGRVEAVAADVVRLTVRGRSTEIPLDRVVLIERPDGLKDGALIGLGLGLAVGGLGVLVEAEHRGRPSGYMILKAFGNGLIWSALGTACDALFDHRRTLYRRGGGSQVRVSPVVRSGVRALTLSFGW